MKIFNRAVLVFLLFPFFAFPASLTRIQGWCEAGGQTVKVLGYTSSTQTPIQASYPGCTVTVYVTGGAVGSVNTNGTTVTWVSGTTFTTNGAWTGIPITINNVNYTVASVSSTTVLTLTTAAPVQSGVGYGALNALASIYSDLNSTPLTNPFTANTKTGFWYFYVTSAYNVDIQLSGGTPATIPTYTLGDVNTGGGSGGGGGGTITCVLAGAGLSGGGCGPGNVTLSATGGTIPATTQVLVGNGVGGAAAGTPGVDYQAPVTYSAQSYITPSVSTGVTAGLAACSLLSTQCILTTPFAYTGTDGIGTSQISPYGFAVDFTLPDQSTLQQNTILNSNQYGISRYFTNNFGYNYSNQFSTLNDAFVSYLPVPPAAFNSFYQAKYTALDGGQFNNSNASNYQGRNENFYATTPGQFIAGGINVISATAGDHFIASNGLYDMGGLAPGGYAEGNKVIGDTLLLHGVPFNGTAEYQATVTTTTSTNSHVVSVSYPLQGLAAFGSRRWVVQTTTNAVTPAVTYSVSSWTNCNEFGSTPCVANITGGTVPASSAVGYVNTPVTFPVYYISNASNASPIVITTTSANNFTTGQQIAISGVKGNYAANGLFTILVIDSTHFSLTGSSGSGSYLAGGSALPATQTVAVSPTLTTGTVSGGFSTSTLVCVADSNDEPEQIFPSAVGSSTVTLTFHQPHTAPYQIMSGGMCGWIAEAAADAVTAASFPEMPQNYISGINIIGTIHTKAWMVIGSPSTTSITVAIAAKGAWRQVNTNSGWSSTNNTLNLWLGAKVLGVSSTPGQNAGINGGQIALADNNISWTSGSILTEFIGAAAEDGWGSNYIVNIIGNFTGAGGGLGYEWDGIANGGDTFLSFVNHTNTQRYGMNGGTYSPPYLEHHWGQYLYNRWDQFGGQYADELKGCPSNGCINAHSLFQVQDQTHYTGTGSIGTQMQVTGATNTTPITITTAGPHNLNGGQSINISGVGGNTAANGAWFVGSVIDSTHFTLYYPSASPVSSVGNGNYTSGGLLTNNGCNDYFGMDEVNQNFYTTSGCGTYRTNLNYTSGYSAVAIGQTQVNVAATNITATSRIELTFDASLGTALSLTCNTTAQQPFVWSRNPGVGFVIAVPATVTTNPDCINWAIFN